jgi:hypothetical protein
LRGYNHIIKFQSIYLASTKRLGTHAQEQRERMAEQEIGPNGSNSLIVEEAAAA